MQISFPFMEKSEKKTEEKMTIDSNEEFLNYEKSVDYPIMAYNMLVRSVRNNHYFGNVPGVAGDVCSGCGQDFTYLVYSKQVECYKNTVVREKKRNLSLGRNVNSLG